MRTILLVLIFLLTTGCNSKIAALERLTPIHFFNFQFGLNEETTPGQFEKEDFCFALTKDKQGNIYCAGHTKGDFAEPNLSNDADVLVIKMSPRGEVIWTTQLGQFTRVPMGTANNNLNTDSCYAIAVDQLNNVYCAGRTDGFLSGSKIGGSDAIVLKLNSDGALQWVKQLGTALEDTADAIRIHPSGDIIVAGNIGGELVASEGSNSNDVFVSRLSPEGTIRWTKQLGQVTLVSLGFPGNAGASVEFAAAVGVDRTGNIYVTGHTAGSLAETSAGSNDVFLWRLDSAGNSLGLKQFGAVSAPFATGNDKITALELDSADNLYFVGGTSSSFGEAHAGNGDAFVFKTDSQGNILWKKQFGQQTSAGAGDNSMLDRIMGLAINQFSVYCLGFTQGSFVETFAGGAANDVFMLELDLSTGSLKDAVQFGNQTKFPGGDNTGDDFPYAIVVDERDRIFIAGATRGNFGSIAADASNLTEDIFIMRLDDNHRPSNVE